MFNANNILYHIYIIYIIYNIYIYTMQMLFNCFFILVLWCSLLGALGFFLCLCKAAAGCSWHHWPLTSQIRGVFVHVISPISWLMMMVNIWSMMVNIWLMMVNHHSFLTSPPLPCIWKPTNSHLGWPCTPISMAKMLQYGQTWRHSPPSSPLAVAAHR